MSESVKVAPNGQWELVKSFEDDRTNPGVVPLTAEGVPVATARTAVAQPSRVGDVIQGRSIPLPGVGDPRVNAQEVNASLHPRPVNTSGFKQVSPLTSMPTKPGHVPWAPSAGSKTPLTGSLTSLSPQTAKTENSEPPGTDTHDFKGRCRSCGDKSCDGADCKIDHEKIAVDNNNKTNKGFKNPIKGAEKLSLNKGGQWSLDKSSIKPEHCMRCKKKPCTCIKTEGVLVDK